MLDFPRWKQLWLWSLSLLLAAAALPSIFSVAGLSWPAVLPAPRINLGLDLAGGSHILLEANADQVRRQRLESMEEDVRARLRQALRHAPADCGGNAANDALRAGEGG